MTNAGHISFWQRLRSNRPAMASLAFIGAIVAVALLAPVIDAVVGSSGPFERDTDALSAFGTATGPSTSHLFGVDGLGRDVFSRTIHGARTSLTVALGATAVAVLIGVVIGLIAGYRRGWTDAVLARVIDVFLAIPYLLLALGLAASCSFGGGCFGGLIQPGIGVVVFVIAVTSWTVIARIVRAETMAIRTQAYVEAAEVSGASGGRIVRREILPNLTGPVIVYASILIPQVILFEAALSFLGVGVQPPTPSWGQMLSEAASNFTTAWWYMLFPGAAIVLTALAFNTLGDALRDALNPRKGIT